MNTNYEKYFLIHPFDILILSDSTLENDIIITIKKVEIDISVKKIAVLKNAINLLEDFSFQKKKSLERKNISKREIIKKLVFDYKKINFSVNTISLILSKEDDGKLYEPIFFLHFENLNLMMTANQIELFSELRTEYFNNFNEFWEPLIEKTRFSIIKESENICLNFDTGINLVLSLQLLINTKTLLDDFKNLEYYQNFSISNDTETTTDLKQNSQSHIEHGESMALERNMFKNENFSFKDLGVTNINNINNMDLTHYEYKATSNLHLEKKGFNFNFQVENLTGEELRLIIDDKTVIKISHEQMISIQKLFCKDSIGLNSNNDQDWQDSRSHGQEKIISKVHSQMSLLSSMNSDFKSAIQEKYKVQNQRMQYLRMLKYIRFQIPSINKSFSVNLLKHSQEIIIKSNTGSKLFKIHVTINIDPYGQKIISLKATVLFKNYINMHMEVFLSGEKDIHGKEQHYSFIISPFAKIFLPVTAVNLKNFQVRPYLFDENKKLSYYQPYGFSQEISQENKDLKNGIYSKCLNKDDKSIFKILFYSEVVKLDNLVQKQIVFDYTVEMYNMLPFEIQVSLNKQNIEKLESQPQGNVSNLSGNNTNISNNQAATTISSNNSSTNIIIPNLNVNVNVNTNNNTSGGIQNSKMSLTALTDCNKLLLNSFSFNLISYLAYDEIENITIYDSNSNIIKINLKEENKVNSFEFIYKYETSEIKYFFKVKNKKLLIYFFIDFIILNELEEDVNINIDNGIRKKSMDLESYYLIDKRLTQSTNEPLQKHIKRERLVSIESDLLSNLRSRTGNELNDRETNRETNKKMDNELSKKQDRSINLLDFSNQGFITLSKHLRAKANLKFTASSNMATKNILGNFSTNTSNKNLNNGASANKSNSIVLQTQACNEVNLWKHMIYSENIKIYNKDLDPFKNSKYIENDSLFYLKLKILSLSKEKEKISYSMNNSEEIDADYIYDANNVYKNHYLKLTLKNKNMVEILSNVKNLNNYFSSSSLLNMNQKESLFKHKNVNDRKIQSVSVENEALIDKIVRFNFTRIITLKNKYSIINNSNLNLYISQDQCYEEG